jgi:phosphoribosyl 1,2-cyclic phosphate phosphodiesterase
MMMQLQFLGTSASEGYPNAFCACNNCETARKLGGPSLRKRSSALLDGEFLIDLGPDLMAASLQHGISLANVRYCLQTHEHADHLDPSHLYSRSPLCGVHNAPRLHLYASDRALQRAARILRSEEPGAGLFDPAVGERLNLAVYAIEPFQHFAIGDYQILSLKANHAPETTALLYLIERNGRTLFYATDTGEMPQATWDALESYGKPCQMVVMDHTFGYMGRATTHLNTEQFLEQVARLRAIGLLTADSRIFATHIGHHSNPAHAELADFAAQHGYEVAYDGLMVEF